MLKAKLKFPLLLLVALLFLGNSFALFHSFSHDGFVKKIEKHQPKKTLNDCAICAFSNLQNQVFVSNDLAIIAVGFLLIFALRFFDFNKLSFLLNCFSSRAPPAFS